MRNLRARRMAVNAIRMILDSRHVSRDAGIPMARHILRLGDTRPGELSFDEMIRIVYGAHRVRTAVVMQLARIAAFWFCRSRFSGTRSERDEAATYASILIDAANQLAQRQRGNLPDAVTWVSTLVNEYVEEEYVIHRLSRVQGRSQVA